MGAAGFDDQEVRVDRGRKRRGGRSILTRGDGVARCLKLGGQAGEEDVGAQVVLGRVPLDVGSAADQSGRSLEGEQVSGRPLLGFQIPIAVEGLVVGRGGQAEPGDGARPENRRAFTAGDVEGELDRSVGVLEGGKLVEQLGRVRLVAGGGEGGRRDGRVVGPRPVEQAGVGRVADRNLVRADELQRQGDFARDSARASAVRDRGSRRSGSGDPRHRVGG